MAGKISHAAAAKVVEMEAAGGRADRDVNENPQQASTVAEKKQHVCTHCGAQHASRSALFRHLRARCDPTLNKENVAKLAVVVAYAGDAQLGADVRNGGPAATTQLVVKAVAAACAGAAGAGAVVQSTHVAVSTEKHAGARANIVIVALRNIQAGARLTATTLDERLPDGLRVLAARFLTNSAADQALAGRLTKRIRRRAPDASGPRRPRATVGRPAPRPPRGTAPCDRTRRPRRRAPFLPPAARPLPRRRPAPPRRATPRRQRCAWRRHRYRE